MNNRGNLVARMSLRPTQLPLRRKASDFGRDATFTSSAESIPPIAKRTLNSGGQPLAKSLRDEMAKRLGRDFADVRIHTDTQAASSPRTINAAAYTFGNQIVFGDGKFTSTSQHFRTAPEVAKRTPRQRRPSLSRNRRRPIRARSLDRPARRRQLRRH